MWPGAGVSIFKNYCPPPREMILKIQGKYKKLDITGKVYSSFIHSLFLKIYLFPPQKSFIFPNSAIKTSCKNLNKSIKGYPQRITLKSRLNSFFFNIPGSLQIQINLVLCQIIDYTIKKLHFREKIKFNLQTVILNEYQVVVTTSSFMGIG